MNYTKKLVSTLLITAMLLPSVPAAFGAAEASKTDIHGIWAESQVSEWIDKGYVKGYEDGSFKPSNTITRAEFITLINRSYGFTETATVSFSDVSSSNWIYAEVSKAIKAGYIKGYANGTFGANNPISRQEAAVIVDRLLNLSETGNAGTTFTDSSSIAWWAKAAVEAGAANGILKGYANDTNFKPNQPLTRAEAVVVLYRSVTVKETLENTPDNGATTPTPAPTTIPSTPAPTMPSTGGSDTTAPTLSGVTIGQILYGDDINGKSNEKGHLFLVPATTAATLTALNQAVDAFVGRKQSVEAAASATITTAGLQAGSYVVYAVDSSNNISIASNEIVMNKKQLTTADPATLASVKMYDGTTSASVTANLLIGVVGDDAVTVNAVATYNDAAIGTGKTITVVYTLSGADAGNYIEPVSYSVNTGVISKAPLSIEEPVLSLVESLERNSVIEVSAGELLGVVAGEDVTVSVEALYLTDDDLVNARPLTIVYTLSGADSGNYIAPTDNTNYLAYVQFHQDMGIIIDLITNFKVYDGTKESVVLAGSRVGSCEGEGICPGDDATVFGAGTYNDKNVGVNKEITVSYVIRGADFNNYLAPEPITVNTGAIIAKQLTIAPPVLPTKVYDGTATAVLTPGTLIGVVEGDDVTVHAAATYNNAEIGTNKQVKIVYTLSGDDAGNYIVPASITVNTGRIVDGPQ
ncbi:hypothetical protein FHS16_004125 [Paenibacillus endophyticus]|uniref:SLH domain-containing protein n=1 Tax=Paenibacillus endophyticus TaxID=1294268 RepID=A0A7W5CBB9_9BACL|nr:YDG domain-containing protein [Paenibacillus endophyticus]MBB3154049.1 hypothetical protein [Paenibacillus endophyticus]